MYYKFYFILFTFHLVYTLYVNNKNKYISLMRIGIDLQYPKMFFFQNPIT
jgi:hypothetical protein